MKIFKSELLIMEIKCVLLLITIGVTQLDAARILGFFPTPSVSHQITFHPLMNELARRGHEVTVITTDPSYPKGQAPPNLIEVDIHNMSYTLWEELLAVSTNSEHNLITQVFLLARMYTQLFEQQMLEPEVQKVLKQDKKHFDLIFAEGCFRANLILSHIFDAPLVQISSFGPLKNNLEAIGAPTHPLLYPTPMRRKVHNLTLWEKFKELVTQAVLSYIAEKHEDYENEMFRRHFGPNAPTVDELRNNIHMLFLNIHPMWAGNMPVPPGVVYTGGIHIKPYKELSKDLKSYLDSSKNGVIYISFGTNIKTRQLTPETRQKFLNVLSKLPYDVLWKWDQDELPEKPANIKIAKWLPQSDLLRHPKIKLFITQGGLQSTDEAILAGVPLLGFPMLGDQWFNVDKYIHFKIGMGLDILNFSEEDLRQAINTTIEDDSYRKNVVKLREQMYDQPQTSIERGVWWTEYMLRHGGAYHLRAPAANMSWAEYYEVKLVSITLAVVLIILFIIFKIVKCLWKLILNLTKKVKVKLA